MRKDRLACSDVCGLFVTSAAAALSDENDWESVSSLSAFPVID